jgi:putative polyketide hydroxylase
MTSQVPVLIVGGGPVGLSASILLSRFGVRSILVERHPSTTDHPKARGVYRRTMELFRRWGVEDAIRKSQLPDSDIGFIWAESLAGEELGRVPRPPRTLNTPAQTSLVSQDAVEEALCANAKSWNSADLRFSTQVDSLAQDGSGVTAEIRGSNGEGETIRADYVISADGASSRVRQALGIAMIGPEAISHQFNIYFRSDLSRWFSHRVCAGFLFAGGGSLLSVNGTDRWISLGSYNPEIGEGPKDFTPEFCIATVRRMLGLLDLPVEIINTAFWTLTAQVAERFQSGRTFLAGDAAHRFPPTGGFGMNTGVQDVHNLVWKLAAVIKGWASPTLLESYALERRPVAQSNTDFSVTNSVRFGALYAAGAARDWPKMRELIADQRKHLDNEGQDLGFYYDSGAIVSDGTPSPVRDPATYRPDARPGSRAPHLWLIRNGRRISSLDLFDTGFVLLAGQKGQPWCAAASELASNLNVPIEAFTVGASADAGLTDSDGAFLELYGLNEAGAVLVRPDGHVAWRSRGYAGDSRSELAAAMQKILCREG